MPSITVAAANDDVHDVKNISSTSFSSLKSSTKRSIPSQEVKSGAVTMDKPVKSNHPLDLSNGVVPRRRPTLERIKEFRIYLIFEEFSRR